MRSYAILLVEDNPDDVKQTLRAFTRNNIANEVVVARDGAEALDYLFGEGRSAGRDSAVQPGLVLLDLKLPRVTGLQVLARLREDERTRGVPVVILTSSSEAQDVAAGYAAGANNYLRKPVHFASFLHAARSVGLSWTLVESGLALLHPEADDAVHVDPPPPVAAWTPGRGPARPMEVLLGMSDLQACARIAAALEADGHAVHQAHAARTVFGRLLSWIPDVLLLDAELSEIGGVDVVRTLRSSRPGHAVTCAIFSADVAGCRLRVPEEEVHILESPLDPDVVVGVMRRIRYAALLRDLATERERLEPAIAPNGTARGALWDAWGLLDLPATAPPATVAHAIQALTNALVEGAEQASSAYVRFQASTLAARLRRSADELFDLYSAPGE